MRGRLIECIVVWVIGQHLVARHALVTAWQHCMIHHALKHLQPAGTLSGFNMVSHVKCRVPFLPFIKRSAPQPPKQKAEAEFDPLAVNAPPPKPRRSLLDAPSDKAAKIRKQLAGQAKKIQGPSHAPGKPAAEPTTGAAGNGTAGPRSALAGRGNRQLPGGKSTTTGAGGANKGLALPVSRLSASNAAKTQPKAASGAPLSAADKERKRQRQLARLAAFADLASEEAAPEVRETLKKVCCKPRVVARVAGTCHGLPSAPASPSCSVPCPHGNP